MKLAHLTQSHKLVSVRSALSTAGYKVTHETAIPPSIVWKLRRSKNEEAYFQVTPYFDSGSKVLHASIAVRGELAQRYLNAFDHLFVEYDSDELRSDARREARHLTANSAGEDVSWHYKAAAGAFRRNWFYRRVKHPWIHFGIWRGARLDDCRIACAVADFLTFDPTESTEGRLIQKLVKIRERSPEARKRCAEDNHYTCFVCKRTIRQMYGDIGTDLIHIHHKYPLSTSLGVRRVDHKRHLIAACPNCHAVMHHERPPGNPRKPEDVQTAWKANGLLLSGRVQGR